jgi:hypothetical protein
MTPYEATRTVCYTEVVDVPVKATRCVAKTVEKEVPVCEPPADYCGGYAGYVSDCGGRRHGLFRR